MASLTLLINGVECTPIAAGPQVDIMFGSGWATLPIFLLQPSVCFVSQAAVPLRFTITGSERLLAARSRHSQGKEKPALGRLFNRTMTADSHPKYGVGSWGRSPFRGYFPFSLLRRDFL
jgi:hypothetical protein